VSKMNSTNRARIARTIEIDEVLPKTDIDNRYLIRPYYPHPGRQVGHDASGDP